MKRLLFVMCAAASVSAATAAEIGDTVVTYNDKTIVINDTAGKTCVSVYDGKGIEKKKTRELTFADGQEIEQVYITSPFMPKKRTPRRRYSDHIPDIYMGLTSLAGDIGSFNGGNQLHSKTGKSLDMGITAFGVAFPFNRMQTFGITTALSAGYARYSFNKKYTIYEVDGRTEILPLPDDEGANKSYISYWYLRVPLIFEWQNRVGNNEIFGGLGVSMELRNNWHSRYKGGKSGTITPSDDLNMNPFGLNAEAHMGFSGIVIGLRMALTPMLNTSAAPQCYPISLTLGFKL